MENRNDALAELAAHSLPSTPKSNGWATFAFVMLIASLVLWRYHDRFWCPADEGAYAYVAERILEGDVLNREVQDVHLGLINFTNALTMRLLGPDLINLRYPLVAMCLVEVAIVFWLTRPKGHLVAVVSSLVMVTLTCVQFLNPTAHWYCLFLLVLLAASLTWLPPKSWLRLPMVGFLVAAILLFRQLSGVLTAIGVICYLLYEYYPADGETNSKEQTKGHELFLARGLCAVMFAGLLFYLCKKTGVATIVLYGSWPLLLIAYVGAKTTVDNRRLCRMTVAGFVGAIVPLLPLVIYHVTNGSVTSWLDDTVLAAVSLTELNWFRLTSFPLLANVAFSQMLSLENSALLINGVFWFVSFIAPVLLGAVLLVQTGFGRFDHKIAPLPFLAVFYAVVSLHFQIPIYLFYSLAIVIVSLIWLTAEWPRLSQPTCICAALLCCVGLFFHAAQPLTRGLDGALRGERVAQHRTHTFGRCNLRINLEDAKTYDRLIEIIGQESKDDETILALPGNAELYFLGQRKTPVRFFNSALGIRNEQQLQQVIANLSEQPPRLVFYRPDDKYNTRFSNQVMNFVRQRYDLIEECGGFEVYCDDRNETNELRADTNGLRTTGGEA